MSCQVIVCMITTSVIETAFSRVSEIATFFRLLSWENTSAYRAGGTDRLSVKSSHALRMSVAQGNKLRFSKKQSSRMQSVTEHWAGGRLTARIWSGVLRRC
jgi:hypothetical protein